MKTTKTKDLRSSTMRFLIDNKAMLLALLALMRHPLFHRPSSPSRICVM